MALPPGRYCAANFGLVMSGLVELGVIVASPPWLKIGDMALPEPLICGPIAATTESSPTILRALVAAWAGSYWPAVEVASSMASMAPALISSASWASAPVNGKLIPIVTDLSAARSRPRAPTNTPANAADDRLRMIARRDSISDLPSQGLDHCRKQPPCRSHLDHSARGNYTILRGVSAFSSLGERDAPRRPAGAPTAAAMPRAARRQPRPH